MPSLRAHPTRRSFLTQAGTLALAAFTLPHLTACQSMKSPPTSLLSDAPGAADSPLAFLATVQNLEADLLHHALNKAAGKSQNARLTNPNDYSLKLAAGSFSNEESAAGFRALVTFAFAADAHQKFLTHLLKTSNITPPKPGKYQLNVPRPNLASLLDALYPLAEITQRSYLAAISQLTDMKQIQPLAAIHSVKSAQLATLAMVLSADPHPRRFDTDEQCARTQFAENDLEYFRDPKLLLESLNQYTLS